MGTDPAVKRPFLAVYDYGQRSVWRVILAESEAEIAAKYPDLQVFTEPPEGMSADFIISRVAQLSISIAPQTRFSPAFGKTANDMGTARIATVADRGRTELQLNFVRARFIIDDGPCP